MILEKDITRAVIMRLKSEVHIFAVPFPLGLPSSNGARAHRRCSEGGKPMYLDNLLFQKTEFHNEVTLIRCPDWSVESIRLSVILLSIGDLSEEKRN